MSPVITVAPQDERYVADAEALAKQLALAIHSDDTAADFVLLVGEAGLSLRDLHQPKTYPVQVDFTQGESARRGKQGGFGLALVRAVGVKPATSLEVLDATAGLGQDSFVLASLGCSVHMLERHPIVAALLADGVCRLAAVPGYADIASRMSFELADAASFLTTTSRVFDVIYLDPMFPHTGNSAAPKKAMRMFRELVGPDTDTDVLLAPALAHVRKRVVVKRPRLAPLLAGKEPNFQLKGESCRFDVYVP